jgi:hypothetical protein
MYEWLMEHKKSDGDGGVFDSLQEQKSMNDYGNVLGRIRDVGRDEFARDSLVSLTRGETSQGLHTRGDSRVKTSLGSSHSWRASLVTSIA